MRIWFLNRPKPGTLEVRDSVIFASVKCLGLCMALAPLELVKLHSLRGAGSGGKTDGRCWGRCVCVWRGWCSEHTVGPLVLHHKWHEDQRNDLDLQSRKVSLKMCHLKTNLFSSTSSHNGVTGTGFPPHLNWLENLTESWNSSFRNRSTNSTGQWFLKERRQTTKPLAAPGDYMESFHAVAQRGGIQKECWSPWADDRNQGSRRPSGLKVGGGKVLERRELHGASTLERGRGPFEPLVEC